MYVAHVRAGWSKKHVYIGRETGSRPASPLANPYRVRNHTKEEHARVCQMYRRWLHTRLQAGDERVWNALRTLRADSVLACYCDPLPCHGHVVRNAWLWAVKQGLIEATPYSADEAVREANQPGETVAQGPAKYDVRQTQAPAAPVEVPATKPSKNHRASKAQQKRDLVRAAAYRGVAPRLEDPITPAEEEAERARLAQIDAALDTAFAARYITAAEVALV